MFKFTKKQKANKNNNVINFSKSRNRNYYKL